jgi:hypothetical protein
MAKLDGENGQKHKQVDVEFLRMKIVGANSKAVISGRDRLRGKSNYFIGNDREKWLTNIPNFGRVYYENIYEGIDLVYYGNNQQLEYDFVVSPGFDSSRIALRFEGAQKVWLNEQGALILKLCGGEVKQNRPVAYQEIDGKREKVESSYAIKGNGEVQFEIGEYDRGRPLVIDPVLVYSTYLGGTGSDSGESIAIDSQRNAYITGLTISADFPILNPMQGALASPARSDAYVTKLNPTGSALIYSTYVGGSVGDIGLGIDVDLEGNAYVAGTTGGSASFNDFPTVNAYDDTYGGTDDAFVLKLNPAGNALIFSTYHGRTNSDLASEVAVDRATGDAYVSGLSNSSSFPTTPGAFMTAPCGPLDSNGFVTKFNAQGAIVYSTLFGGCSNDTITDIAVDSTGHAYVTGSTSSSNFPVTPGSFDTGCTGCEFFRAQAFASKLNPEGSGVVFSGRIGGSLRDSGLGVGIDSQGNTYITGDTESINFPTTPGAFQPTRRSINAFVTKISADGSSLIYSTYLGGSVRDVGRSIAADAMGNAYVTGSTRSTDFPTMNPIQPNHAGPGSNDAFVSVLNSSGSALIFSTYLGGISRDDGYHIVVDDAGNAYATGQTFAANFPTTPGAFQTTFGSEGSTASGGDAFVVKIKVLGNLASTIGLYRPSASTFYLRNSNTSGFPDTVVSFGDGPGGDIPIVGDWDGDGAWTIGVYRPSTSTFYLRNSNTSGFPDLSIPYGAPGDLPVAGDWDGDGIWTIGLYRAGGSIFYLHNSNTPGFPDLSTPFGAPGDRPLAGNWDGL